MTSLWPIWGKFNPPNTRVATPLAHLLNQSQSACIELDEFQGIVLSGVMKYDTKPKRYALLSNSIHVWYIYLHLLDFYGKCRVKIYYNYIWILLILREITSKLTHKFLHQGLISPKLVYNLK